MASLTIHASSNAGEIAARLRELPAKIDTALIEGTSRGTDELESEYRSTINVDTGRTAATIQSAKEGMTGYVGSDDEIAGFLEYGTSTHVIEHSQKKALYWPGAAHPVDSVIHPGTPEYAPLLRAGLAATFAIEEIYGEEVEKAFGSI